MVRLTENPCPFLAVHRIPAAEDAHLNPSFDHVEPYAMAFVFAPAIVSPWQLQVVTLPVLSTVADATQSRSQSSGRGAPLPENVETSHVTTAVFTMGGGKYAQLMLPLGDLNSSADAAEAATLRRGNAPRTRARKSETTGMLDVGFIP